MKIADDFIPRNQREWDMVRAALLEETDWTCHYCDIAISWRGSDIDHAIPRCQGGTDHFANLHIACASCNRSKGGRNVWQWREPENYDGLLL